MTTPPPYGQYPQPPVDPAIAAARETRKTVIWGMSIWVFGPVVAAVVVLALCCGGCLVSGAVGSVFQGDPLAQASADAAKAKKDAEKASADAAQAEKDQASARAGLTVGAVNLRASFPGDPASGTTGTIEVRNGSAFPLRFDSVSSFTLVVKKAGKPVVLFPQTMYSETITPGATKTIAVDDPSAAFVPGPYVVSIEWGS